MSDRVPTVFREVTLVRLGSRSDPRVIGRFSRVERLGVTRVDKLPLLVTVGRIKRLRNPIDLIVPNPPSESPSSLNVFQ